MINEKDPIQKLGRNKILLKLSTLILNSNIYIYIYIYIYIFQINK